MPEPSVRILHRFMTSRSIVQVECDELRACVFLYKFVPRSFIFVEQYGHRAILEQLQTDSFADALGATGYDEDFIFDVEIHDLSTKVIKSCRIFTHDCPLFRG